jgi:organic hydroperoxide reductase OsmC/OhrA
MHVTATVTLDTGKINAKHLVARGKVSGLDRETFKQYAEEAGMKCPVSNLLRPGLTITVDADFAS